MGTEWYLIDYTNKRLVSLHKACPTNIDHEKDYEEQKEYLDEMPDQSSFYQYWHGRVIDYIYKHGIISCKIVSEHSSEYEELRYNEMWEVI